MIHPFASAKKDRLKSQLDSFNFANTVYSFDNLICYISSQKRMEGKDNALIYLNIEYDEDKYLKNMEDNLTIVSYFKHPSQIYALNYLLEINNLKCKTKSLLKGKRTLLTTYENLLITSYNNNILHDFSNPIYNDHKF